MIASLFFGAWHAQYLSLFFALPLSVIGNLCSVIVARPVHLPYYFPGPSCSKLTMSLVNVSLKL